MRTASLFAALSFAACAAPQSNVTPAAASPETKVAQSPQTFEKDRQAILAMVGDYHVTFQFIETAAMRPGYTVKEPYRADGNEIVTVVEDTGKVIDLQHVLVVEGRGVVKHWRQRWSYEDPLTYAFVGDGTWAPRHTTTEEARGTWTQAVFQVDDSPRYEGRGRWVHDENFSSWTSERTWRPLPRREHTKRSDYDVLSAVNRHTITPQGWLHEQDNYKLDRKNGEHPIIALEAGLNVYQRVTDVDFSPARAYWEKTAPFWADVRAAWAARLDGKASVQVLDKVAEKHLWEVMFTKAGEVEKDGYDAGRARAGVDEALRTFLTTAQHAPHAAETTEAY